MNPFEETCYRKKCLTSFRAAYESLECGKLKSPIEERNEASLRKVYEEFYDLDEDSKPDHKKLFNSIFGENTTIPLNELKDVIGLFSEDNWTIEEAMLWSDELQELDEHTLLKLKEFINVSHSIIKEKDLDMTLLSEVKEEINQDVAVWYSEARQLLALLDWKNIKKVLETISKQSDNPEFEPLADDDLHDTFTNSILGAMEFANSGRFDNAIEVHRSGAKKGWGPAVYEVAMSLNGAIHPDPNILSGEAESLWSKMLKRSDVIKLEPEEDDDHEMRGEWDTAFSASDELKKKVNVLIDNKSTKEFIRLMKKDPYGELIDYVHETIDGWLNKKVGEGHSKPKQMVAEEDEIDGDPFTSVNRGPYFNSQRKKVNHSGKEK